MLKNKSLNNLLIILGFVLFVIILFVKIDVVENEGFNPSDEGVVLAQSWRLINGEIPHKDFISIRPVGSGYLHAINLLLPGALVVTARWFVLFQYFTIALVISLMFFKEFQRIFNIKGKSLILLSMIMVGFALTTLNFIMYSWTTVDAIFWCSLALPMILYEKNVVKNSLGLIFLTFAALSRQTFLLISLFGNVYLIYIYRKDIKNLILVLAIGLLPYFAYLFMLLANGAFKDFMDQMLVRSEFFKTAVLKFGKRFVSGSLAPFNFLCIFISILLMIRKKHGFVEMLREKGIHVIVSLLYGLFSIIFIVRYFLQEKGDLYEMPFEIFFMLATFILFHYAVTTEKNKIRNISISILLISWISAISLGANTPVYSVGIMFLALFSLMADLLIRYPFNRFKFIENKYILFILSVLLFGLQLYSQQNVNYRDNKSSKLVSGLNYASNEFGNIKTNPAMIAYYSDLKDILDMLPHVKDNVVVFPCNAIFYPVMETMNPMCLDWLNHYEYNGLEGRVEKDLIEIINNKNVYFIIDKINVRDISKKIELQTYENDLIYDIITSNCFPLESGSDFFEIYKSF